MESTTLCSVDQCATPFDVHCFHCRTNMCSQHYFEHKQQQEQSSAQAMDDLLQLASSKCFCITNGGAKHRPKFSNPFVSSKYLLKKMRQRRAKSTKTTITVYNLRKRPSKFCKTIVKSPEKLCNRKLPCPYHHSSSSPV